MCSQIIYIQIVNTNTFPWMLYSRGLYENFYIFMQLNFSYKPWAYIKTLLSGSFPTGKCSYIFLVLLLTLT